MERQMGQGQTLTTWMFTHTWCVGRPGASFGAWRQMSPSFSCNELPVRPGDRCTRAGILTRRQEGAVERREGLEQRRGKAFAKSIRWAEWDKNREIG